MKKRLVFLSLFLISFALMFTLACAQETKPLVVASVNAQTTDYTLPYPGILPDHPLYFLKQIRDWILKTLISQPVRKTEFEILLSDKTLNMAIFLADQGKKDLSLKTLGISVDYLQKAEKLIFEIPASEKSQINNIKDRFEKSLAKHQETINNLSLIYNQSQQNEISRLLELIDSIKQDYLRNK